MKLQPIENGPAAIEAREIGVTYGNKAILRGVTVRATPGEVLGVLGPSGAGKSTLFRALVGDIPVTFGEVLLFDKLVTHIPMWGRARHGVAYLPQTPSVLWDLTVHDNLRTYHRIVYGNGGGSWLDVLTRRGAKGDSERHESASIASIAKRVALEDKMNVKAGALSGGERRRLELARALVRPPKVLICDEPFAGVDPQQASRLGDMLRSLAHESGVAVLLADHHVAEALCICSRVMLLVDGQVAMEGSPREFQEHPVVVDRYLRGRPQGAAPTSTF
ncbi:MAG: ATP-binding cassette domain-containing protein [Polyangiaceae bacterium]|nr:ATP-binding cassette domain-containing protein [Polyangiaceae bacterium]